MKKSVIAFAILTTVTIVLLVLNMSKSQTIDNLTKEKATLEQKVADIQTEVDSIKSQLDQANEAQKKQKEEFVAAKDSATKEPWKKKTIDRFPLLMVYDLFCHA